MLVRVSPTLSRAQPLIASPANHPPHVHHRTPRPVDPHHSRKLRQQSRRHQANQVECQRRLQRHARLQGALDQRLGRAHDLRGHQLGQVVPVLQHWTREHLSRLLGQEQARLVRL